MRSIAVSFGVALAGALVVAAIGTSAGCGARQDDALLFGGDAAFPTTDGGACVACTTSAECNGAVCAQFQGDIFCAPACPNGDECSSAETCSPEVTSTGEQVSVCVPKANLCGIAIGPATDGGVAPGCDAGSSASTCGSLVGPDTTAGCNSCGATHTCQPNGCYGGWWCDTTTSQCHAQPANCSGSGGGGCSGAADAGPHGNFDAGGVPITGSVGATGGSVSRLYFTAVGDTRPASIDDTAGYPIAVVSQIYTDLAALNPAPAFSISTGDYMFASTGSGQSGTQLDLYLAARAKFGGTFFPALGNHECTGATASNCGTGNANGVTQNFSDFMTKMLGPIQKSAPYYAINVNETNNAWSSKFVFVAANAWDSGQASWLTQTMAQKTTYTFVVRHESSYANTAPGVSPSDQILNASAYTLLIVGHSHTYGHPNAKEVLFGNGGAPLTGGANFGFGVFQQRQDGAIVVDEVDYQSGQADPSFHFAVNPDGSPAP